jgi:hypothetical protein
MFFPPLAGGKSLAQSQRDIFIANQKSLMFGTPDYILILYNKRGKPYHEISVRVVMAIDIMKTYTIIDIHAFIRKHI